MVLNPDSNVKKKKYKDLKDEEFVPLECFEYIDEGFKGIYKINKLGWIKTISTDNIRKRIKSIDGVYPQITLSLNGSWNQ